MTGADGIQLTVDARFCGPPGAANGGYLCGLIGSALGRTVTVRLNRPAPLLSPLILFSTGPDEWELRAEGQAIALVRSATLRLPVPDPPSYIDALDASLHFSGFQHHPCPGCFVCGIDRVKPDGLRIFAGKKPGSALATAGWIPDRSLMGPGGKISAEFMSAALDCPGFFALTGVRSALLGEFTAHIDRLVHIDEPCRVVGWELAREGRKYRVGTAVFDEDGECCGYATGLWIGPRELDLRA